MIKSRRGDIMPRDYIQIEKNIAETGFFSEYLPPCFKLDSYTLSVPPPHNCDLIEPYCFTMSRYNENDARRSIFIPEIGAYLVTRNYIKQEKILQELIEFSESVDMSFSPILNGDDEIVRHEQSYDTVSTETEEIPSNYIDNIIEKIIRSSGAKKILKLDISNCFSSFYMHMMPAILLGVDDTQVNFKKFESNPNDVSIDNKYCTYRKLDEVVRRQNLNRTNGLLTGPLYSKIISEAFLTRIDKELTTSRLKFSRYVDDYEVYLFEDNEKAVISTFTNILKRYGLSLNYEKTEVIDFPYYVTKNLAKIFDSYTNNGNIVGDVELLELFNSFASIEKDGTKGALRYLIKTLEKKIIKINNPAIYKAYLISILENNERSLTKVCSLLIKNKEKLPLNEVDIVLIKNMLQKHILSGHDLEVLWLLYLLIETENLCSGDSIINNIFECKNELAKIILLRKGFFEEEAISQLSNLARSWILLYELYADDHLTETDFQMRLHLNKNLDMYKKLKNKNIHFCN